MSLRNCSTGDNLRALLQALTAITDTPPAAARVTKPRSNYFNPKTSSWRQRARDLQKNVLHSRVNTVRNPNSTPGTLTPHPWGDRQASGVTNGRRSVDPSVTPTTLDLSTVRRHAGVGHSTCGRWQVVHVTGRRHYHIIRRHLSANSINIPFFKTWLLRPRRTAVVRTSNRQPLLPNTPRPLFLLL